MTVYEFLTPVFGALLVIAGMWIYHLQMTLKEIKLDLEEYLDDVERAKDAVESDGEVRLFVEFEREARILKGFLWKHFGVSNG